MTKPTGRPRVGNRTNHDAARMQATGEQFKALTAMYKAEVDSYKKMAEARRKNRKYTQESLGKFYERLGEYVDECERKHEPLTVAGMLLALNLRKEAWQKAKLGELDYLLEEYISLNNITDDQIVEIDDLPFHEKVDEETGEICRVPLISWGTFAEKASMMIEAQLERNCYTNKGNPAGSIFGLKAHYGYRDDPQTPQHLVQNLVIADSEQAKKAMQMLTNVEK